MWLPSDVGWERTWVCSPSTATAARPPPHSVSTCSQSAPSVEANSLWTRSAWKRATLSAIPRSPLSPASACASTASLSSSGTSKGSRSAGLVYVPIAGGSSASAAPGAVGCAAAIASARSSACSASALPVPRTAAKPQAPPTRTRTPIPSESSNEAWSTSPLRVASRSDWVRTNRASAYSDRPAAASIKS